MNEHRASLWIVHQDLDFEDCYVLAFQGITSVVKNDNNKYSFGWGPLFFANSPRDLSLPEDSDLHVDSDLDFCNKNINAKNEKNKRPFCPFLPVYNGHPGDIEYIVTHKYTFETTIRGYQLVSTIHDRRFGNLEEILVNYYPTIYPYQLYTLKNLHKPFIKRLVNFLTDSVCNPIEDEEYKKSDNFFMSMFLFILEMDSMEEFFQDIIDECYEERPCTWIGQQKEVINLDSGSEDEEEIGSGFGSNVVILNSKSDAELKIEKLKKMLAEAQKELKKTNEKNKNNNNNNNKNKNKRTSLLVDWDDEEDDDYEPIPKKQTTTPRRSVQSSSGAGFSSYIQPILIQAPISNSVPTPTSVSNTEVQIPDPFPIPDLVPIPDPIIVPAIQTIPHTLPSSEVVATTPVIVLTKIEEMRAARLNKFNNK